MTDTILFTAQTGTITPVVDTNTFEVTDPFGGKTVVVEGLGVDDSLNLVRRNYADDGWEPYTENGQVQLNARNKSLTPTEIGVFGLQGIVTGTVTAYTKEP